MSNKELGKLALIQGAIDGVYTVKEVAKRLGLTERRVKQLKKAVRLEGEGAVIHGNAGRHPANYTPQEVQQRIIDLKRRSPYDETNFTHFRELLAEREHLVIGYTALSNILKRAGIVSKKRHRTEGKRYRRRKRRSAFGELVQADATPYDWFGTGEQLALHGFIDDATGRIVALYMLKNECLMGYLELLRYTLTHYGVPLELYADKAGIFFVNNKKSENWSIEEQLAGKVLDKTQFGLIAEKLGITLIAAHTPQAKGRIERLWETLQDRLPVWFKLNGISDIDAANAALPRFLAEHNERFSVDPELSESSFVALSLSDDLEKLLSVRYERVTDNCGCFSFQNWLFQIDSKEALAKKRIVFLFSEKAGFLALYNRTYYPVILQGPSNKSRSSQIPDVTKALIQKYYLADGKLKGPPL